MYAEFVGLTPEAVTLVERLRLSAQESKSDILVRVLSALLAPKEKSDDVLQLGQGAFLRVGEQPMLFLSEAAKRLRKPDAIAEVRSDGLYLDGVRIKPSKGSVLQPAMKLVQERKGHRNADGALISLSAWRQWHVIRDGDLLSMVDLKDPALAHRRGRAVPELTLRDLGLA